MSSKNWMLAGVIVPVVFVSGCLVVPNPHARMVPLLLAPPLPPIVVFDTEPYYVQQGYHYHYQNNGWYYSRSRSGPWTVLPKDRCPREVRYRDGGPAVQIVIAPPLPPLVVFDTEPYYVQQGFHYHYQNNGWYYSRSRSGPWTILPKDRCPREARYRDGRDKDGRHGDDKGHAPQVTHPITPDRHQEVKKPEHTFGSDRNHLQSASGREIKTPVQPVERHERVVTPIPGHQERVQHSKEIKPAVAPSTRHPEISQPPKEYKAPVLPLPKKPETIQQPKERNVALTQPVVRKEAGEVHSRSSRTAQPERKGVKQPVVNRSETIVLPPQAQPSQPVVESKEKKGKESGKKKEHSR